MTLIKNNELFCNYYERWLCTYKKGTIRDVTLEKYKTTLYWLKTIAPKLKIKRLDRSSYQNIINIYAETHEKQTTMDFHRQLKSAIIDMIDEGLLKSNPTTKVVIKGKLPTKKKPKFLNLTEMKKLVSNLNLPEDKLNYDWLILLISKTGLRFSEAVALTPSDFNFDKKYVDINKTWDYKHGGGFAPTKNDASIRKVDIDKETNKQFKKLCKDLPDNKPIFILNGENIFNSTVNDTLTRHCKKVEIPNISLHGLRHTHASLLLYAGVSISSVSKRLGHSNMATTQKIYLHTIQELKNKDNKLIMSSLALLNNIQTQE